MTAVARKMSAPPKKKRDLVAGRFEVEEIAPGKWRCLNTVSNMKHVLYGTRVEIEESLGRQAAAERRVAKKHERIGAAWRGVWR